MRPLAKAKQTKTNTYARVPQKLIFVLLPGEHASLNAIHSVVPNLCPKSHANGVFAEDPNRFFLVTDFLELGSSHPGGSGQSFAQKLAKLHTTPAPVPSGFDELVFGFPATTC